MARRSIHEAESLNIDQLKKPVIFVIDMVNGFVSEGALADKAIAQISKPIQDLIESLKVRTIFVCDAHNEKAKEFQSYPIHCLKGSQESQVMDELAAYNQEQIDKNSTNTFMAPGFQKILPDLLANYTDFIITGCCTDLCILQFALSLQSYLNEIDRGANRIIIPENCVDTYQIDQVHEAKDWNEAAIQNMKQNGILVVSRIEE